MNASDWVFAALMVTAFVLLLCMLQSAKNSCLKLAESFDKQQAINADFDKRLRGHWANIAELRAAVSKGADDDAAAKILRKLMADTEVKEDAKNGE